MKLYNGARDVVGRAYSHDHAMVKVPMDISMKSSTKDMAVKGSIFLNLQHTPSRPNWNARICFEER